MAGVFVLLVYLLGGVVIMRAVLWEKSPVLRVWLGMSLGVALLMWLPVLFAFVFRFTMTAELCALATLLVLCSVAVFAARKRAQVPCKLSASDKPLLIALLLFALPMTVLSGYLQWSHTLKEVDGA
ncbi:MAG TPA: hypothetical protein IAC36_05865, partial [Candidatus Aphodomonas merdavium]|nr:hypothetical protein [Candidatus Aphodomonas merdavium]